MRKYFEPEIEIRELILEDVITTSGVNTLTIGEGEGSLEGEAYEELGDAIFF